MSLPLDCPTEYVYTLGMENVSLTRSEALDILAAVESARLLLEGTEHLTVVLDLENVEALLTDRLF